MPPLQPQQQQPQPQQQLVGETSSGEVEESLEQQAFQAQHLDPGMAVRSSSLYDLGGFPVLSQEAESFSNQGGAPALHRMNSEGSVSNSAFSSEEHMSSRHKLSEVVTKLNIMVACLQECASAPLVEIQSDNFNQKEGAHLGMKRVELRKLDLT